MISRKLLKMEIDKVQTEYLELLYRIIKLFESGTREKQVPAAADVRAADSGLDWHDFVATTYGSLADAPIVR